MVPTYLPATRYGGPIYSVHGLCKALAALGHDVHVFTTNVDGDTNSEVPLGSRVFMDGVKVWYFPSTIGRRLYWSPDMLRELRASLASFEIVHLHSVFLWPTWAAARQAHKLGMPYVLSPRGMLVKDLIRRKSRCLKTAWIGLIEARNIRRASLMHFTAGVEEQEFEKFGFAGRPHCVIPNGVDLPGVTDDSQMSADIQAVITGEPYLLFLGRLNWKKGLDRLVAAMASLPGQRLLIVGNDEEGYIDTIRRLVRDNGVEDRVTVVTRFVTGTDKQALYAHARLFVLPSYSENFGNTVPEAMAQGCPVVVTTEVGAADLVVQSNGGVVTAGKQLADTLNVLLEDSDRLHAMGRAGKAWVEGHLSWASVASAMVLAYQFALNKGRT